MALTNKQVILYMKNRNKGATQEVAAARSGISVRSARRLDKGQLQPVGHHHWRTRKDPLEQVWQTEVQPLLEQQPALTPITVLEHLQDSHPGQYPNSILRTLQRRIRTWKSQYGGEKEVMFIQEHQPGAQAFVDFTELKGINVTIAGQPLSHRLFHFRLPWSHWSWMSVVLGGESYSALVEGMQNALHQLGGVPVEIRTDSLSAAWRSLSDGERTQQTARYAAFCEHYGVLASHNNPGKGHENGAVESAHGHLKRRIRQALLIVAVAWFNPGRNDLQQPPGYTAKEIHQGEFRTQRIFIVVVSLFVQHSHSSNSFKMKDNLPQGRYPYGG